MKERYEPIYEKIAPDEVFLLYKDSTGVTYIGNKDGKAFIKTAKFINEKRTFVEEMKLNCIGE